ncbi:MAG: diguanylate cyclase [Gaiellaceae bacterium]|nr:diguanylate cyclase [Gaiellaceae bacterium]
MSPAALPNRLLVSVSALVFGGVFVALVLFERPGLGIGHFFYIAIALLALAVGPRYGAVGGIVATCLFSLAVTLNHDVPTRELLTVSTPIRFVTYVSIGALLGWFAEHYKTALAEAQVLAERDWLTGLPSMRGFEKAIDGRLATGRPFGLVLANVDGFEQMTGRSGTSPDDALRSVAEALGTALSPEDDIARIGGAEFAILCTADSVLEASRYANRIEQAVASAPHPVTVGWAGSPTEGRNALSLYRAADERLYARRLLRTPRRVGRNIG